MSASARRGRVADRPAHGPRHPGPEAGEHAGIPGAGEDDREHQNLRGMGGNTA